MSKKIIILVIIVIILGGIIGYTLTPKEEKNKISNTISNTILLLIFWIIQKYLWCFIKFAQIYVT